VNTADPSTILSALTERVSYDATCTFSDVDEVGDGDGRETFDLGDTQPFSA